MRSGRRDATVTCKLACNRRGRWISSEIELASHQRAGNFSNDVHHKQRRAEGQFECEDWINNRRDPAKGLTILRLSIIREISAPPLNA